MIAIPSWVAQYIGLPYAELGRSRDGVDCWGLVKLVLSEQLGLQTMDCVTEYSDVGDRIVVPPLIRRMQEKEWVRVEEPQEFDTLIFNIRGQPMHVGLVVNADSFLHSPEGKMLSALERYTDRIWARRIEGFYRHVARV